MGTKENFTALLQRLEEGFIRSNSHMVDINIMARALKNIDSEYQEKVLRNITPDAQEKLKSLLSEEITPESIESAQNEILSLAQGYV